MSSDFGQSQQYKYQGKAALSNGRAQQAAYEKRARALETEAVSDSHLAARNMGRMRQNQNAAMASVRAARGGSGLTSEGSGQQAEIAVADVWESAISDASLSNAISDSNKRFAAESSRHQGSMAMMAAQGEADQYKMLSQNALGAAIVQTALTVAGGAMGAAGMTGGGMLGGGVGESAWGSAVGGAQGAFSGMMNAYSLSGSMGGMVPGSMQSSSRLRDSLLASFMGFGKR
ncbi:hypothetical protein [Akkermansia sp.]